MYTISSLKNKLMRIQVIFLKKKSETFSFPRLLKSNKAGKVFYTTKIKHVTKKISLRVLIRKKYRKLPLFLI